MDGTEETQDLSSEEQQQTSEETPETFTKEQRDAEVAKARSDALSDINRYKTESEKSNKAAQAALDRVDRMLKEQEEAELEAARDDSEKLTNVRLRQSERRTKDKLAQAEQELKDKDEELTSLKGKEAESTKERNAREIATRLGVDSEKVIEIAKFTDGSTEVIEAIASSLPKKTPTPPLKPVYSGTTSGSKGIPTETKQFKEWIAGMSQEEYERLKPEIDEARKKDLIK